MQVRKTRKIVVICVLCIVALLFLCLWSMFGGSDYTIYPGEKATTWICHEPHIKICFRKIVTDGYLEWNEDKIPVVVAMQSNVFEVYRAALPQEGLKEENILFRGYWHYEGKDMVMEIYEDNIFNGTYSELTFAPQ